jgi:hypothetical protein
LSPELPLLRVPRSYKRRIAHDDVESAVLVCKDAWEVDVPSKVEGTVEIGTFELPQLGIKL